MPKRHRAGASATSLLRHVEDVVVATSGEDAFEIVFAVAAALVAGADLRCRREASRHPEGALKKSGAIRSAIVDVAKRQPLLEVDPLRRIADVPDELLSRVEGLLRRSLAADRYAALDAVFEALVPRVAKADKGQFFTPRHVVDFVVRLLAPEDREVVLDPACGSGAFLAHARGHARVRAHGADVDARAVRVARLLALAGGGVADAIVRADGLRTDELPLADVVATNPPFAGRAPAEGFAVAELVRTPERDVLFLERAVRLLRPGGRLGIVLPYNKASGESFALVRRWLVDHARVFAVVGLPRETFLPHTGQRTFVLFAKRRRDGGRPDAEERSMFLVSERAGKDSGGEPIFDSTGARLDHDLDEVAAALAPFLRGEGFYASAPARNRRAS